MGRDDQWRWRFKAGNHEAVANGGEGYSSRRACFDAVERIRAHAAGASIKEIQGPLRRWDCADAPP